MVAIIKILYKTKNTFDYLDDKYEDQLDIRCSLIFLILGAISGFESFYREIDHIKDFTGTGGVIVFLILSTVLGAGLGLLTGRYLLTYTLYGLGKLVKGIGKIADIRVVAAYSLIPTFFQFPIVLYLGLSDKFNGIAEIESWIINTCFFLIWIWTIKILLQGVIRFHKFGILKALVTISPLIVLGFGFYALPYIICR